MVAFPLVSLHRLYKSKGSKKDTPTWLFAFPLRRMAKHYQDDHMIFVEKPDSPMKIPLFFSKGSTSYSSGYCVGGRFTMVKWRQLRNVCVRTQCENKLGSGKIVKIIPLLQLEIPTNSPNILLHPCFLKETNIYGLLHTQNQSRCKPFCIWTDCLSRVWHLKPRPEDTARF